MDPSSSKGTRDTVCLMPPLEFRKMLLEDPRYKPEAYQMVREALGYAQTVLGLGKKKKGKESHLTGQQLCEAIRAYAIEQYGMMAKLVLNSWGVRSTSDFGEIVYNLIRIEDMKKSPTDRREDFDEVYDFEQAFQHDFRITQPQAENKGKGKERT